VLYIQDNCRLPSFQRTQVNTFDNNGLFHK
jgi:hypothetical protein